MDIDDATTLKLWAGASERDKVDAAGREGATKRYAALGFKTGRTKRKR